jgi:hypothetical protein
LCRCLGIEGFITANISDEDAAEDGGHGYFAFSGDAAALEIDLVGNRGRDGFEPAFAWASAGVQRFTLGRPTIIR